MKKHEKIKTRREYEDLADARLRRLGVSIARHFPDFRNASNYVRNKELLHDILDEGEAFGLDRLDYIERVDKIINFYQRRYGVKNG